MQDLTTETPQASVEDLVRGFIRHVGLDQAGVLVRQLGYGEYFSEPPEDVEEHEQWLHERYTRDVYGYFVSTDIFTFFQRNLHDVREAQDYALQLVDKDDSSERLDKIDKASSLAEVLAALGQRVASSQDPTFGVEDCIRRIRERLASLPFVQEYGEEILKSDVFRGRMLGLWSEVDALLKLLLIFYAAYFSAKDRNISDAFGWAIQQKNLGSLFRSIEEVERCFDEGETSRQFAARSKKLRQRKRELEDQLAHIKRHHNKQEVRLLKKLGSANEQIIEQRMEIHFNTSSADQNYAQKRIEVRIEGLQHQLGQYKKELKQLEDQTRSATSSIRDKIASAQTEFELETQRRRTKAEKLRRRCKLLLDRTTPFERMDLDQLRHLVSPYRNAPAHLVQELLMKPGAIQEAQTAGERILGILHHWLDEGLFPRTASVVKRWQDIYGRTCFVLAVNDPSEDPKPLWSMERLIWMYEWKTRPWSDDEICLVAAKPRQMVFEPIVYSWSDLKPQLMSVLDQGAADQEEP